jgi:CHAD domain-containing protein
MNATPKNDEDRKDFCGFGALLLKERLEAMRDEIEGAKERADIEHVHQLSVYSRRIRAALPLFQECFETEDYTRWRKRIKKVTKSLGTARDADVQIEFLKRYRDQAGSPTEMKGIDHLIHVKREEREAAQPKVVRSLEKLQRSDVLEEMFEWCGKNERGSDGASPHTLFRGLV